jgi:3-methylcrotonyl-CoA carboxylase alpha subunit
LRAIAAHPAFAAGELDTGFIARHHADLFPDAATDAAADTVVQVAATLTLLDEQRLVSSKTAPAADPYSPWGIADAWRMNSDGYQEFCIRQGSAETSLRVYPRQGGYRIDCAGATLRADWVPDEGGSRLAIDGVLHRVRVVRLGAALVVILDGDNHVVTPVDRLAPPRVEAAGDDRLSSPIPARVARILVQPGDKVKKGAPLMVLEAMKMEISLSAPMDGVIATVRHRVDDMVQEGADLITFETVAAP